MLASLSACLSTAKLFLRNNDEEKTPAVFLTSMNMFPWSSDKACLGKPLRKWSPSQFWETTCLTCVDKQRWCSNWTCNSQILQVYIHLGHTPGFPYVTSLCTCAWGWAQLYSGQTSCLEREARKVIPEKEITRLQNKMLLKSYLTVFPFCSCVHTPLGPL